MNIFKNRPLALCCAVFLSVFYVSFYIPVILKLCVGIIALIIGIVFVFKNRFITVLSVITIFSLLFGFHYFDLYLNSSKALIGKDVEMKVEVTDITYQQYGVVYFDAKNAEGKNIPDIHFTLKGATDTLYEGNIISVTADITEIASNDDFDSKRYYRAKGMVVEGEISNYTLVGHKEHPVKDIIGACQNYCVDKFSYYTDEDASAILSALSVGDKSNIDDSIIRDFSRTGISHMLAISGMHFAVIMGFFIGLAQIMHINRRVTSVLVILICICFILLSGTSLSVLRAGSMFMIMITGGLFRRISDSITSLFFGVSLIVLFSPSSVFDAGLILSFTSTLGIVVILGYFLKKYPMKKIDNLFHRTLYGAVYFVKMSVLTTLSALSFSFIPLVLFFDNYSLGSVLSNVIISPIMTVLLCMIPVFLLVSYIPMFATLIGGIINILVWVICRLNSLVAAIPNVQISLEYPFVKYTFISVAVGIVIVIIIRKRSAYMVPYLCWFLSFCLSFFCYNFSFFGASEVLFYSEAGSDAVIIQNGKGYVYLDAGTGSLQAQNSAFEKLKNEMYGYELDYWIITDYTRVGFNSISRMMNEFYIHNILVPTPKNSDDRVVVDEIISYAEGEMVSVIYYDYEKSFTCNGNDFTVYDPITFETNKDVIISADIECNGEIISYYGRGYFDNAVIRENSDYLYLGETGSKRKQKLSPELTCDHAVIAEKNDVSSANIKGKSTLLNDDVSFVKLRIG